MRSMERNGHLVLVVDRSFLIQSVQQALDLMGDVMNHPGSEAVVIRSESLPDAFFDLKTCFAGEVLQKFSSYGIRLAIVENFEGYASGALQAFIRECNKGSLVFWKGCLEDALDALCGPEHSSGG